MFNGYPITLYAVTSCILLFAFVNRRDQFYRDFGCYFGGIGLVSSALFTI